MKATCLPLLFAALLMGLLASFQSRLSNGAPIRVTGGQISGTTNQAGDVQIYRGIPFAAPPVGELRWKAPQPVKPWSGIRKCEAFGPSPMQGSPAPFGPWSAEYLIPKEPIGEDCLYLNIWAPSTQKASTSAKKSPVVVWIYGGGFGSGGSACPIYDGEAMAKKGIVFVSFNYRVGPFGFFAHPELTKESGHNASGNYGLMDQIAALQWVKQNVARFGGDPGNVTIAGQSAGSMSVNCLVASPLAKGLFTKAIAESGASFGRNAVPLAQAEEGGLKVMQTLGATSLAELRARSADEILQKGQGGPRGPIVDGYVLPESVPALFAAGKQNKIALLTGWNQDEGLAAGPFKKAADYQQQMTRQYGPDAPALLKHYPSGTDDEAAASQRSLSRDMTFGVQNYTWANVASAQGQPVYVYRFTRKVPATGQYAPYGAFHTGEVPYAYDNLRFIDPQLRPMQPADVQLARQMSTYWANFIRTGNPNGQGLPQWPAYSARKKQVLQLDTEVQAIPLPDEAALDILYSTLSKR